MPNRILKESIRTSKGINALNDFHFRVWAYLLTYVDDFGRGSAEPDIIKGFVFPRRKSVTEANIQEALGALACTVLIRLYEVDGDSYLYFPGWEEHQNRRAAKSKFPEPTDENTCKQMQANESECEQAQADVPDTRISNLDTRISNLESRSNTRAKRFTPPTVEEVTAYVNEKGYNVNPERFIAYYESNGWMVGKNHMKDWKAAIRTWVQNDKEKRGNKPVFARSTSEGYVPLGANDRMI